MRLAISAYSEGDKVQAQRVLEIEPAINKEQLDTDQLCSEVIARRQPAAKDLRLLLGVIRTISDLERVADEAAKIAKLVIREDQRDILPRIHSIFQAAEMAILMLRKALDAFAREDGDAAREVMASDSKLDEQYIGSMRQLITYMMEDPRTIGDAVDDLWVAKAIERIGDHAENIAEVAIYVGEGEDVRYSGNLPVQNSDSE